MPAKSPEAIARKRANDAPKRRARALALRQQSDYNQREAVRKHARQSGEWSLGSMWLMTADGEADNAGTYDQFSIYDGERFYDLGAPHTRITFSTLVAFFRMVHRSHKRQDKNRRANVFHFFSYHYDLDIALSGDTLLTEQEKQAIAHQRSNSYGVEHTEDWQREIELSALRIALYVGRKETVIRYLKWKNGEIVRDENGIAQSYLTLHLVDTYTLTAMPFLKTIKPLRAVLSAEEQEKFDAMYALIERGKAERGHWSEEFTYEKRQEYNHAELVTMHWWLSHIIKGCQNIGLTPRSLAGPAPFARALIYKYGLTPHVQPPEYNSVEYQHSEQMLWQKRAYYGARIEMCGQGVVETHTELDITSAYPAQLANAPCFAHGYWEKQEHVTEISPSSIYHVSWTPKDKHARYGPLPVRNKMGGIYYPLSGDGYYFGVEVLAILPYWRVALLDGFVWVSTCEQSAPFHDMVHEMVKLRAEKIATGDDAAALTIKLALNSQYGIFAQSAGAARIVDDDGNLVSYKLPKFYNLATAGYITAATRAQLYAAAQAIGEQRILGFATDALFIDGELSPDLAQALRVTDDEHKILGLWTMDTHHDATAFIAPGVRSSASGKIKKSRGYPVAFKFPVIVRLWEWKREYVTQKRQRYVDIRMSAKDSTDRGRFVTSTRITAINSGVLATKRDVPDHFVPSPDSFTIYPPYKRMFGPNCPYRRRFEKSMRELLALDTLGQEWVYYE